MSLGFKKHKMVVDYITALLKVLKRRYRPDCHWLATEFSLAILSESSNFEVVFILVHSYSLILEYVWKNPTSLLSIVNIYVLFFPIVACRKCLKISSVKLVSRERLFRG